MTEKVNYDEFGNEVLSKANYKVDNMTQDEYVETTDLALKVMETLKEAYKTNDPSSELAQKAVELHRKWLSYYWDEYSFEAHKAIAEMYVDDDNLKVYYDIDQPGTAEFLRDAVMIYINNFST